MWLVGKSAKKTSTNCNRNTRANSHSFAFAIFYNLVNNVCAVIFIQWELSYQYNVITGQLRTRDINKLFDFRDEIFGVSEKPKLFLKYYLLTWVSCGLLIMYSYLKNVLLKSNNLFILAIFVFYNESGKRFMFASNFFSELLFILVINVLPLHGEHLHFSHISKSR